MFWCGVLVVSFRVLVWCFGFEFWCMFGFRFGFEFAGVGESGTWAAVALRWGLDVSLVWSECGFGFWFGFRLGPDRI